MWRTTTTTIALLWMAIRMVCQLSADTPDASTPGASGASSAAQVDFDAEIRPILAQHCWQCHGQSEAEAGLNLTTSAGATRTLDSGQAAIVPGDLDHSALWQRVSTSEEDQRMPPDAAPLSARDQERLRQWIVSGASWPSHWAYRSLVRPPIPAPQAAPLRAWCRNPIDCFVATQLERHQLQPAPPASSVQLVRRLYFDLWGLPPTPASSSVPTALADSAEALDALVDQLLAGPQLGERWARHWLDVVHYAESHGHDQDRPREHAWPYRDYVIRALNEDRPYARFVQEQLAGDVLFPDEPWSVIGTGMLAAGPWDESSLRDIQEDTVDREVARYLDRDDIVTTVMSTFQSTSVHCARCHDHKFDPVTQREYYALQAVFAGTDKANRLIDLDPAVALQRRSLVQQAQQLPARIAARDASLLTTEIQQRIDCWENQRRDELSAWQPLSDESAQASDGATLSSQSDGSWLAGGASPDKTTYTIVGRSTLEFLTALRLELLPDPSLPQQGPGRQPDNGNLHLSELRVLVVRQSDPSRCEPVPLLSATADFDQEGWTAAHAIDGDANTAWGIHPQTGRYHQALWRTAQPVQLNAGDQIRIELWQHHGRAHTIGRMRVTAASSSEARLPLADSRPPDVAKILTIPPTQRSDEQQWRLVELMWQEELARQQAALPPPTPVYCGTREFIADGSFRPAETPRPVRVLQRGNLATPLEEAAPGSLHCLEDLTGRLTVDMTSHEGARRAALAEWLCDERNGLTWRSIANRVWQYHFGRGLVDTPNDFGHRGDSPSHPELLDWLACELREHEGSLKHLHRLITTSATYRQSTQVRPAALSVDAENRWLWRMNRRRLDAESYHDALLVIAGTLTPRMGGPSDRQFVQSPGVHVTPVIDYEAFNVNSAEGYRRSIYRFVFRSVPDPFLESLDCPDASQLTPQRTESVTALQTLATLHDKFVIGQAQHLANRLAAATPLPHDQVRAAFGAILGREPQEWEADEFQRYVAEHGLANACRYLFNSNEFMFVE